jgi:O-acetyl-ADP-ribose deacetylase (regulator of RNase III)
MIHIVTSGDLFTCGADAITNTVNCKGTFGAGLAKEFKKHYPDMFVEYAKLCKNGLIRVGQVWVWRHDAPPPLFIVNFPTKDDWRTPSQLSWIRDGLVDLKNHVIIDQILSLALPALGCGLGELVFDDVRQLVEEIFGPLDIEITLFAPR